MRQAVGDAGRVVEVLRERRMLLGHEERIEAVAIDEAIAVRRLMPGLRALPRSAARSFRSFAIFSANGRTEAAWVSRSAMPGG